MKFCVLWLNLFADMFRFVILTLRSRNSLAAENLFLRKQLAIYQERGIEPCRTSHPTRLTLLWLSRLFDWRSAWTVVTPGTLIGWRRRTFWFFWQRKCQAGRPPIPLELQALIRRMADENPSGVKNALQTSCCLNSACACPLHDPRVSTQDTIRSCRLPAPRPAL